MSAKAALTRPDALQDLADAIYKDGSYQPVIEAWLDRQLGTEDAPDSRQLEWARAELERADLLSEEGMYGAMLGDAALELLEVFTAQGHSGMSAQITAKVVGDLFLWKPLSPPTDDPAEWNHVAEEAAGQPDLWQNNRYSACFSEDGGKTYHNVDETIRPNWFRRHSFWRSRSYRRGYKMHTSLPAHLMT